MGSFGVYVHIPFCAKRCDYCAFATWTDRAHLIDDYVAACRSELEQAHLPQATSVFFGGGTPSLIAPELLASILNSIDKAPDAEVTVECNPDTVSVEMFETYRRAGVNRISMGVQSMVPHVLEKLGRSHDRENVHKAVQYASEAGIERVNVDLIYGSVGESMDDWRRTITEVLSLNPTPTHISAYGLTVEAGTPLAADVSRHPEDDDQADKYIVADELLVSAGLENYEISNWAKPSDECRHNQLYWRQGNYRGIGCAAHSHQDGHRWWNVRTPDRYIDAIRNGNPVMAADERLTEESRRFEGMELALRMREGVPADVVPFDELEGFVERRGDRAVLTRSGRLMANAIALRLRV